METKIRIKLKTKTRLQKRHKKGHFLWLLIFTIYDFHIVQSKLYAIYPDDDFFLYFISFIMATAIVYEYNEQYNMTFNVFITRHKFS